MTKLRRIRTLQEQLLDGSLFEVARQAREIVRANLDAPALLRELGVAESQWQGAAGDDDEPTLYRLNIRLAALRLALNALHGIPK